ELPHLWQCDPAYYKKNKDLYTKAIGLYFPIELISRITDDIPAIHRYNDLMLRTERGLRFVGNTRRIINSKMRELSEASSLQQLGIFIQVIDILSQSD